MNQSHSTFIVILVTASSEAEADKIASTLIEQRLVACINRVPIHSMYRWQGKIQCDREWQLIIKTQHNQFNAVSTLVESIHSYEVPEIIALPIMDGYVPYLNWLAQETTDSSES